MTITTITQEFTSPIAPSRLFKALIIEPHDLLPKLLPQFIKSVEILQGDGGAGSIEQINFIESDQIKYAKHHIIELDKDELMCKYAMIEGHPLAGRLESIRYEIKFDPSLSGNGCICKMTSEYHGLHEVKEEDIESGKESAMGVFKAVEAYLLQNPHACI